MDIEISKNYEERKMSNRKIVYLGNGYVKIYVKYWL
jgi:hypothetical protein